jgi:hypothetical protein
MSRYECKLPNGRRLAYGLDKATGGYFCSESYGSLHLLDEVEIDLDTDLYEGEALTLSALIKELADRYSFLLERERVAGLVADFLNGHPPAAIQRSVALEYGADLDARLWVVTRDLLDHFSEYF